MIRAGGMVLHSAFDGIAIGGGFAIDPQLGILVAVAVIMHAFSDGMSVVTILKDGLGHKHRAILPFLCLGSLAPLIGAFIGFSLAPEEQIIATLFAIFSGFFIFLALSDILPQAHRGKMSKWVGLFLTALGILGVFFILTFAHA
jgi:zinc transporter ZupT